MTVTARDQDRVAPHNTTRFSLRSNQRSARFFLIDAVSGVISLKESILEDNAEKYDVSCFSSVTANDAGRDLTVEELEWTHACQNT